MADLRLRAVDRRERDARDCVKRDPVLGWVFVGAVALLLSGAVVGVVGWLVWITRAVGR